MSSLSGPQHDRNSFDCGIEALDRYFRTQAGQDARKNVAAPFVLALPDGAVGGYYTLSATALKLTDFPAPTARRIPRYPSFRRRCWDGWPLTGDFKAKVMGGFYWPTRSGALLVARLLRSR